MSDTLGTNDNRKLQEAASGIRIVMADVDGTLLTDGQKADPETVKAVSALRRQGILFGLCTGRETASVLAALKDWGLEGEVDVVIGSGGSDIADLSLDRRVRQHPLGGELIRRIMKHYEDMPVSFVIPEDGLLYAFADDVRIRALSEADQIPYRVVEAPTFLQTSHPKVMLTFAPELMEAVRERAGTFSDPEFAGAPLVTASILFEYMDPRVSKPAGLKELLSWHRWGPENLCAFGDEDNDCEMLRMAGVGVAMANGSRKTREAADYVTEDNNHAGIAAFLNRFLL